MVNRDIHQTICASLTVKEIMLNLDLARAHHDELRRVAAADRRHPMPARRRMTARRGVFRRTR